MKFINFIFINSILIFLLGCGKSERKDISQAIPEYRLINEFSNKITNETGLVLCGYGVNNYLPKGYEYKNSVVNFNVSYNLKKTRFDTVTLDESRRLLVSVAEGLLKQVNSNQEIVPLLESYPLESDSLHITFFIQDENQIGLGSGVSEVYFSGGMIKYRRYEIEKYSSTYPADGKHYTIHEETYDEALKIVKEQGNMITF